MEPNILVTGGTGTLGRRVVPRLQDAGRAVRVLSRRSLDPTEGIEYVTGDLATGQGIDAAIEGAETIVHLAGSAKGDEDKARSLVRAASLEHTTLKDFMLRNALSAADAVIERPERTTLSEPATRKILDLLDHPREPNPHMIAILKAHLRVPGVDCS